jgi:tetratricopeptide (TPR) repeat protein
MMRANPTPNFFVVLDLLIRAFHLDHNAPDLSGSGPFQHQLSGRRFDLKDETLQRLLREFSSALLRSEILPVLRDSLLDDRASNRDHAVLGYLGGAASLSPCSGDQDATLADRLAWLATQHEEFLAKARSQDLGSGADPAFALLPIMRFAWHHLTFAITGLRWCGLVQGDDLDGLAPHMTWWMEKPAFTPMRVALEAAGITRGQLALDLCGSDSGLTREWDEKTLGNLWHGGPSHPEFETIEAVVKQLCPTDPGALARWRRWYGLRELARQFAQLWGWEMLNGCLATTLEHARVFEHDLRLSALRPDQRRIVGTALLWAGWRPLVARFTCESVARNAGDWVHPTLRADYRAIGAGEEGLRIDECVANMKGAARVQHERQRLGRSVEEARGEAVHICWNQQGDLSQLAHKDAAFADPAFALISARERQEWPAAERTALELARLRPEFVEYPYRIVEALAHQGRFDEALATVRNSEARFPGDRTMAQAEVLTLMLRGEHRQNHTDFEQARDRLRAMNPAESEWESHLLLADCHLALGDWEAAREACRVVNRHSDQCGEARAIASICSAKLGERQPEHKAAEHAERRGEQALLAELRRRDAAGVLGTATIRPIPRWHRLFVQRAPGAVPGLSRG